MKKNGLDYQKERRMGWREDKRKKWQRKKQKEIIIYRGYKKERKKEENVEIESCEI